jgi:hypothetical protein
MKHKNGRKFDQEERSEFSTMSNSSTPPDRRVPPFGFVLDMTTNQQPVFPAGNARRGQGDEAPPDSECDLRSSLEAGIIRDPRAHVLGWSSTPERRPLDSFLCGQPCRCIGISRLPTSFPSSETPFRQRRGSPSSVRQMVLHVGDEIIAHRVSVEVGPLRASVVSRLG